MKDAKGAGGKVEVASLEGAPVIRLSGECDLELSAALREHIQSLVSKGQTRVIFDLERVTFLDSTVLGLFLLARHAVPEGGEVILLCRPGFVRRLLALLEMDRIVRILTPEEWRAQTAAVQ
jgi:anti-anti-sigma factor